MNHAVRFRGRRDVPLDDVGQAEAREAGQALAPAGIRAVYSSPLERALDVGRQIALASELDQVRQHAGLINVDYGEWEGLTREECLARDPELFALYANEPERSWCPGGESLADAADRALTALITIAGSHPGESIAAVTHGAIVRLVVLRVMGPGIGDWQFALPTGSATVLDIAGDDIKVVSVPNRELADRHKAAADIVNSNAAEVVA